MNYLGNLDYFTKPLEEIHLLREKYEEVQGLFQSKPINVKKLSMINKEILKLALDIDVMLNDPHLLRICKHNNSLDTRKLIKLSNTLPIEFFRDLNSIRAYLN